MKNRPDLKLIILFILLIIFIIFSIYIEISFIPKIIENYEINIFLVLYEFFKIPIFIVFTTILSLMLAFKNVSIHFSQKSKIYSIIVLIVIFILYLIILFNYHKIPYFNILFSKQKELYRLFYLFHLVYYFIN